VDRWLSLKSRRARGARAVPEERPFTPEEREDDFFADESTRRVAAAPFLGAFEARRGEGVAEGI